MGVEFVVLGPLGVLDGDRPVALGSAKQRKLLAALLVHPNEVVSVDRLADILWASDQPIDPVATLQTYVSRLRRLLEPSRSSGEGTGVLLTRAPGYLLRVDRERIDASRFERLLSDARDPAAAGHAARAAELLDQALQLWSGPAFAEFADEEFARSEATRLEELRRVARDERTEALLALGRDAELVGELEAIVAADPLRERPREQMMIALYRCGRHAEALRAYQDYRRYLGEELGIEPPEHLQRLEDEMLHQAPHLDATRIAAGRPQEPSGPADAELTFLLTDLEDSTRLWDEHPDAMPTALARHDVILRDAIEGHGGTVVKTTGDGVLAVLGSVPDAVGAAADALRTLSTEVPGNTGPLRVRMGIHTGKAEQRDGDYFGPAVNRCARLMAAAHGGQVLLSRVSAELARDELPEGLELADLGYHRLRGLSQPEHVSQLSIAGLRSQFPPLQSVDAIPVNSPPPGLTFGRGTEEIVGRSDELEQLERAWRRSGEGAVQVALVAGEPGIGKTRLAVEMSRRVHEYGGFVLYGRSDQELIVPYQPFVEALRSLVAATDASVMRERLQGMEADLARVFPELGSRIGAVAGLMPEDPEAARYRLFEAMTLLLTGIAAAKPVMLVLDDLHWADRPTLLLLRHVMRTAPRSPLLIVACYRDAEVTHGHPLAELLGDLRRETFATWVTLHGLSIAESAALLREIAAPELADPVAEVLNRETGGNPLFLKELLRHLIETDALPRVGGAGDVDFTALDLPESVRDVVIRRVQRLSSPANDALRVAAVVGPDFEAVLLGGVLGRPIGEILESMDEAMAAGLVATDPAVVGKFTFSHSLVRQALYADLGIARRTQLHSRVALGLEAMDGPAPSAALLAQHFTQAMPLVDVTKAIEYTTRAGNEASDDFAFEEAAASYARALDLVRQHAPNDTARYVELLIARADALVHVDERVGVEAALEAIREARAIGSPEQLGRAVVVFSEPAHGPYADAAEIMRLLSEAGDALGHEHPALRARLAAIQAFKYVSYEVPGEGGWEQASNALRLARAAEDPLTLANALLVRATSLEGTSDVEERIAIGHELVTLGQTLGGSPWTFGLRVLARAHLELGDVDALTSTVAEFGRIGEEFRWLPARVYQAQWRATQALFEGRFDEVDACAQELREHTRSYRGSAGMRAVQGFFLQRERGEVEPFEALSYVARQHVNVIYPRALLASAQLANGEERAALAGLDVLAADDFHQGRHESGWPAGLALLAEVASAGASDHASTLREMLSPFAGRLVVALVGLACLGATDRFLGMLSASLGLWDDADAAFERALGLEQNLGGRALVARTLYWRARARLARGRLEDVHEARLTLATVIDETGRLGMRGLRTQAEDLAAS